MPKITKRVVDALRPPDGGETFLWDAGDGALKGFGIRMKPSGAASYLVQYRNKEGRTRRLVIGKVGTILGEGEINIADFSLGRRGTEASSEREAIAVVHVDGRVSDEVLAKLRTIPAVQKAKAVRLF